MPTLQAFIAAHAGNPVRHPERGARLDAFADNQGCSWDGADPSVLQHPRWGPGSPWESAP